MLHSAPVLATLGAALNKHAHAASPGVAGVGAAYSMCLSQALPTGLVQYAVICVGLL